jgi:alpha-glucoside transport system substrate-binding protein
MRKHRTLLIAVLAIMSLVAAACSPADSDSTTTEPAAATTEAPATDTTEAATTDTTEAMVGIEGTTVTVFGPESSDEEAGAQQDALNVFAEANGMEIIYTGARDFSDQINAQAAGGNPPDIAVFPQPGKVIDFANEGFILPVPQAVVDVIRPQWPAGTLETVSTDAGVFGIMNKTDLKSIVWYSTAVFADGGYAEPQTLDELIALGDQMVVDGVTPWCVGIESGGATGWPFTDWMEDLMLRLHGADVYDQWVAHEIPFDDQRVQDAANQILDIWNAPGAVYAAGGSIAATPFGDNGVPLVDGTCAMHRQASFYAAFLPEGTVVGDDGEVNVFYFPSADDSRPVLTAGTYVSAFRDAPEVWAVIEYMGTAEYANARQAAQVERLGGGQSGFLSANLGADLSVYNELEQSFVEILLSADPARFDASDLMPAAVGAGTFWSEGTSAVNGDKTVEDAFAAIEASWP